MTYLEIAINSTTNKIDEHTHKSKRKTIILSKGYGGFTLSKNCLNLLRKKNIKGTDHEIETMIKRDDEILVNVVKTLGIQQASGNVYGFVVPLAILEFDLLPNQDYKILDEDGAEYVIIFEKTLDENNKHPVVNIIRP